MTLCLRTKFVCPVTALLVVSFVMLQQPLGTSARKFNIISRLGKAKPGLVAKGKHGNHGNSIRYLGNYDCEAGRDVMVELFEWKWRDIGKECRNFLHKHGYCAVQVSSPLEHRIVRKPRHPWWERYQPVSYLLNSRSGDLKDFIIMLIDCNSVGVRVYVDAVINHMAGKGSGRGWARSPWSGDEGYFPQVPYSPRAFHRHRECPTKDLNIHSYNDPEEVRNCQLLGLRDLKLGKKYVRRKVTAFLNKLIDLGVAGFRIDAAKHIWPRNLYAIYRRLHKLRHKWFPPNTSPFIFQEVPDYGGEPIKAADYTGFGRVTEFKYGHNLGAVIQKTEGQRLAYLKNYGKSWGFMDEPSAVVFTDNHDTQRYVSKSVLTFRQETQYKIANAFMLAWPYGFVRIMSSYHWPQKIINGEDKNNWMGPPSDFTVSRRRPKIKDAECFNGQWVCEHRWPVIASMVGFHNAVLGTIVQKWWDNSFHAVAFARGRKGFIVINNEDFPLDRWFDTGLPAGHYCDVIHCDKPRPPCIQLGHHGNSTVSCQTLVVKEDGWVRISVPNDQDPMVAIHV